MAHLPNAGQQVEEQIAKKQGKTDRRSASLQALLKAALDPQGSFRFPSFLGWPLVRKLPPLIFGFGIRPEHVQQDVRRQKQRPAAVTWIAGLITVLALIWIVRRLTHVKLARDHQPIHDG